MSVVGSDNFEDAPLLPFGEWSAPTPSADLTADAQDTSDWYSNTAWWKVVIPADHDPATKVRFELRESYIAAAGDSPAELSVYQGESRDTLTNVSGFSRYFELDPAFVYIEPGAVYYVQAKTPTDDPNVGAVTYVLGVGDVLYSYGDWQTAAPVMVDPIISGWANTESHRKEVGLPEEPDLYFDDYDTRDENILAARNMVGGTAEVTINTGAGQGRMQASVIAGASTRVNDVTYPYPYRASAQRADNAIAVDARALGAALSGTYRDSLLADMPEGAADVELEDSTYTPKTLTVEVPVQSVGDGLYVRMHVGPAEFYGDTSGATFVADERLWPPTAEGQPNDVTSFIFSTSGIGSTGLVLIRPESVPDQSPAWVSGDPVWSTNHFVVSVGHIVCNTDDNYLLMSGTVQGPRYRYRYEHFIDGYVPTTIFGIPPLRQVQRGDGLGFSSAPRAIQNNSVQGSLRNFGFN